MAVTAEQEADRRLSELPAGRAVLIGAAQIAALAPGIGMLATLRREHPVLAVRPEREQLLVAALLATYRSVRTRRAYAGDLADWLGWLHTAELDPLQARRVHVDLRVRGLLDAGAAASSTARRLSALSGWYRHLAEHDLVGANPVAPVRRPRVDADHTATVGLDRDQARALIAAADAGPARLRSAAAVRLLLHLGLRVDELARADTADLGHDRGHRTVTVTRKGVVASSGPGPECGVHAHQLPRLNLRAHRVVEQEVEVAESVLARAT